MSDAHRPYVIGTENGCDDLDEEQDPKVEGGMDAYEYLETLSTPRELTPIPTHDD